MPKIYIFSKLGKQNVIKTVKTDFTVIKTDFTAAVKNQFHTAVKMNFKEVKHFSQ